MIVGLGCPADLPAKQCGHHIECIDLRFYLKPPERFIALLMMSQPLAAAAAAATSHVNYFARGRSRSGSKTIASWLLRGGFLELLSGSGRMPMDIQIYCVIFTISHNASPHCQPNNLSWRKHDMLLFQLLPTSTLPSSE